MLDNGPEKESRQGSVERVMSHSSPHETSQAGRRARHQGLVVIVLVLVCSMTLTSCFLNRDYTPPPVINAAPPGEASQAEATHTPTPLLTPATGIEPSPTPTDAMTSLQTATATATPTPTATAGYELLLSPVATSTASLESTPTSATTPSTSGGSGGGSVASPSTTRVASATPTPTSAPDGPGDGSPAPTPTPLLALTLTPATTPTPTPAITVTTTATPQPDGGDGGTGEGPTPTQSPEAAATPTPTATPTQFGGGFFPPPPAPTATPTEAATFIPTPTVTPVEGFDPVVDLRLLPDYLEVEPGDSFGLTIVIEPNGQEVSAVQVIIRFDPAHLEATSSRLDPDSPLRTKLVPNDFFDNGAGTITLSAGPYKLLQQAPTETFTMGSVTFNAKQVDATTEVDFVTVGNPNAVAGLEGVYITGELFGSTIKIGVIPTPTPTPTPTETPTPTPTP